MTIKFVVKKKTESEFNPIFFLLFGNDLLTLNLVSNTVLLPMIREEESIVLSFEIFEWVNQIILKGPGSYKLDVKLHDN